MRFYFTSDSLQNSEHDSSDNNNLANIGAAAEFTSISLFGNSPLGAFASRD
jgi:hypothetical protein